MSPAQPDALAEKLRGLNARFAAARIRMIGLGGELPDEPIMVEALKRAFRDGDIEFAELLVAVAERFVELAEGKTWGQVTGHA
ncbi:MAG: hypothetical protein ACREEU_09275 [Acetobacteraceae bacterium]